MESRQDILKKQVLSLIFHQFHSRVHFKKANERCSLCHTPGSPCDGQADERVLVRQPVCPSHCSAGQENRLATLCHQGNERLSLSFCTSAGPGCCMKDRGRGSVREGALCWTPLGFGFFFLGAKVLSRFFFLSAAALEMDRLGYH